MALTKRLTNTFDTAIVWTKEVEDAQKAVVNRMISEGKTDGKWSNTQFTFTMDFVDQAAAEEYTTAAMAWNVGREIVSSVITDI